MEKKTIEEEIIESLDNLIKEIESLTRLKTRAEVFENGCEECSALNKFKGIVPSMLTIMEDA